MMVLASSSSAVRDHGGHVGEGDALDRHVLLLDPLQVGGDLA